MISNQELRYVNAKSDWDIPYPGDNYSKEALLELKNAIALYNTYYKDRKYEMLFSNGENMEFSIAKANLAHIVGVNYGYLNHSGAIKEIYGENIIKGSYDLLNDMVDNVDDILKLNAIKNYNLINFYRIKTRSEIFSKFSNFSDFNFGCIFFDREIAEKNGHSTFLKSNKFLCTDSDDPSFEYYMMGIASNDENENDIYAETLFPCEYPDKMFKDQIIATPTVISTTTPKDFNKITATAAQKLRLSKAYKELEKKYGAKFDYFHDYYATLAEQSRIDERQKVLGK